MRFRSDAERIPRRESKSPENCQFVFPTNIIVNPRSKSSFHRLPGCWIVDSARRTGNAYAQENLLPYMRMQFVGRRDTSQVPILSRHPQQDLVGMSYPGPSQCFCRIDTLSVRTVFANFHTYLARDRWCYIISLIVPHLTVKSRGIYRADYWDIENACPCFDVLSLDIKDFRPRPSPPCVGHRDYKLGFVYEAQKGRPDEKIFVAKA